MERLRRRELRAFSAFVRGCYASRDVDALTEHALGGLPRLIDSHITTFNEMNVATRVSRNRTSPAEIGSPERVRIWNSVMHEHPVLMHAARTGDGRARKISDFLSVTEFHRLALYGEHFGPQDAEDMMGVALSATPDVVIGIAVHRNRRSFSGRDRLVLNLLRPHLVQAYQNARACASLREDLALARRALGALDQAAIVMTREHRVTLMTEKAALWVVAYFEQNPTGGRLPDALERWVQHHEGRIAPSDDVPVPRRPLVVDRVDRRLTVRMVSTSDEIVLILDEESTTIDPRVLEALGLGRRESEVLTWVTRGRTNPEIATILGLSPRTVQKHIERILQKLGVETRTAAAAMAIEAARARR